MSVCVCVCVCVCACTNVCAWHVSVCALVHMAISGSYIWVCGVVFPKNEM